MSDSSQRPKPPVQLDSPWWGIPKSIEDAWRAAHPEDDPNAPKINRDLPQTPAQDFQKGFGY